MDKTEKTILGMVTKLQRLKEVHNYRLSPDDFSIDTIPKISQEFMRIANGIDPEETRYFSELFFFLSKWAKTKAVCRFHPEEIEAMKTPFEKAIPSGYFDTIPFGCYLLPEIDEKTFGMLVSVEQTPDNFGAIITSMVLYNVNNVTIDHDKSIVVLKWGESPKEALDGWAAKVHSKDEPRKIRAAKRYNSIAMWSALALSSHGIVMNEVKVPKGKKLKDANGKIINVRYYDVV